MVVTLFLLQINIINCWQIELNEKIFRKLFL